METLKLALSIAQLVLCVLIIVFVLMQQGASQGMGAIDGGSSETHFGKSGSTGIQGVLSKATAACALLAGVIVILLNSPLF